MRHVFALNVILSIAIRLKGAPVKDSSQARQFSLKQFLPFQMAVVANALFSKVMAEAGLQVPEWRIMMALPAHQPCSSHDLCILTAMDAARVSRAQRRLEELQMIEITQDNRDRRRLVVQLSDKGSEEIRRLTAAAMEAECDLLDKLGPEDRNQLRSAINGLFEKV